MAGRARRGHSITRCPARRRRPPGPISAPGRRGPPSPIEEHQVDLHDVPVNLSAVEMLLRLIGLEPLCEGHVPEPLHS